jgi:CheY-like chemotaxis protein
MSGGGPSGDGRALRVLVVEDEPVNRALLRAVLLGKVGATLGQVEVTETDTLAGARAAVSGRPDVIILDVRLPDGIGLDLLGELPAPGRPGRPYIIVMSASVLPADREAARRSGGDAFLAKPFLPADLVALLERVRPAAR